MSFPAGMNDNHTLINFLRNSLKFVVNLPSKNLLISFKKYQHISLKKQFFVKLLHE